MGGIRVGRRRPCRPGDAQSSTSRTGISMRLGGVTSRSCWGDDWNASTSCWPVCACWWTWSASVMGCEKYLTLACSCGGRFRPRSVGMVCFQPEQEKAIHASGVQTWPSFHRDTRTSRRVAATRRTGAPSASLMRWRTACHRPTSASWRAGMTCSTRWKRRCTCAASAPSACSVRGRGSRTASSSLRCTPPRGWSSTPSPSSGCRRCRMRTTARRRNGGCCMWR